jgi:protein-arginine kinase activator protein McsA
MVETWHAAMEPCQGCGQAPAVITYTDDEGRTQELCRECANDYADDD